MGRDLIYNYKPAMPANGQASNALEVPREVKERALGIIWHYVYVPRCHWPENQWFGMEFQGSLWDLKLWREGINRYATIYAVQDDLQTDTSHYYRLLEVTPFRSCRLAGATTEAYLCAIRNLGPIAAGRPERALDKGGRLPGVLPGTLRKGTQG